MKDIMTTGKRSQVARLVCEPSLVILSLVTLVYRFLEKDFVLENVFLTLGGKSFTCGRALTKISSCWVYETSWPGISLQKQPFNYPCSSPLGTFCKEEPLGLSNRNSRLMKNIFHMYCLFSYRFIARHIYKAKPIDNGVQ